MRRPRAGFTLVELTIAALLLGAIFVSVIPVLGLITRDRREAERRQLALIAAENLLDRLAALPYSDLTVERVARYRLPETVAGQLPEAALRCDVSADDDSQSAKRISVELRWQKGASATSPPMRLTAWVFPSAEAAP
ncbi:MAG: type IV pilus modification PilV family protein [Planctomycetaceae bacterium]